MKNTVIATIEFYFKGKKFTPSISIDLNEHLQLKSDFPNLCALIASTNKIDHYSYEYEMMQAEEIQYTNPEGLVANHISNGELNIDEFLIAWQDNQVSSKLLLIAERHMELKDLGQYPELLQALLDAYKLGKLDAI
jgi:hypothetical protein